MDIIVSVVLAVQGRQLARSCPLPPFIRIVVYILFNAGGGIFRDLFLLRHPPAILTDIQTLLVILVVYIMPNQWFSWIYHRFIRLEPFLDGCALSHLLHTGWIIATRARLSPLLVIVSMVVTSALGGIMAGLLRAIVSHTRPRWVTSYRVLTLLGALLLGLLPQTAFEVVSFGLVLISLYQSPQPPSGSARRA